MNCTVKMQVEKKIPDGYKLTEAGMIPEDWEIRKIGDIAEVIRGASPRPKGDKRFYGGNIPRLMVEDVTRDGKYVTPSIDSLTEAGAKLSRPCDKGTLTLVCSGTVGVPSILAIDACIHDGFLALSKVNKSISIDYLYHFFTTQQDKFNNSATHGGIFTNLTTDGVREFLLALPRNKNEQTAIASFLSDIDTSITVLEQLITKKKDIKIATMQQLLTGRNRLPQFAKHSDGTLKDYKSSKLGLIPEDWQAVTLGYVTQKIVGGGTPSRANPNYWGNDIPWVTVKDFATFISTSAQEFITRNGLANSSSNLIPRGTLIISTRMALGKAVIYDVDVAINQDLKAIFTNEYTTALFLFYWFEHNTRKFEELGSGSTVKGLALNDLKGLDFLLMSIDEQMAITTILSDMDAELTVLEQKLSKIRDIKQGMMQQLLTGRIRLQLEQQP
ncbi:restriction endonuclease subunit S [Enterobacter bugandensis]|uniref:restriction endonuclease subunit S n=1 Tax=Enterobacter bugandensis TaxID=881260 RepID=UPI002FD25DAF